MYCMLYSLTHFYKLFGWISFSSDICSKFCKKLQLITEKYAEGKYLDFLSAYGALKHKYLSNLGKKVVSLVNAIFLLVEEKYFKLFMLM